MSTPDPTGLILSNTLVLLAETREMLAAEVQKHAATKRECAEAVIAERYERSCIERELWHARREQRWSRVYTITFLIILITNAARYSIMYPGSWDAKVARTSMPEGLLFGYMVVAGVMMLPFLVSMVLNPVNQWRRRILIWNIIGLAMGAFGFAAMAFLVTKFDAPHMADHYGVNSVACIIFMLSYAAHERNNIRRGRRHPLRRAGESA